MQLSTAFGSFTRHAHHSTDRSHRLWKSKKPYSITCDSYGSVPFTGWLSLHQRSLFVIVNTTCSNATIYLCMARLWEQSFHQKINFQTLWDFPSDPNILQMISFSLEFFIYICSLINLYIDLQTKRNHYRNASEYIWNGKNEQIGTNVKWIEKFEKDFHFVSWHLDKWVL